MGELSDANPTTWSSADISNCVYGNTSIFDKIGCHEKDIPSHRFAHFCCSFESSADESSGDVIELIKGEFGGLGAGEGHGFVCVRCVGVGCVCWR